ncbi:hypothetical protein QBC46DRAFT_50704 [Diplogelasinospora grovesii]|uniref:CCHC-type domain-containing protein n=1 Tax=Diplogelasinospora grovesii TaxID=303347 RepID=A0AAN6MXT2_9PEZI|nr:hypothetical protein QBC46DRAFT_50704 [Diplogelasinospora grovesii]
MEERFKWAETRQTTREEDWAYCLLGIFGIFMPLIYGEGKAHAVRRLKKEIVEAMSRNDPPNRRGGGKYGHYANDVHCYKCGEYGHYADDDQCYKCSKYGHYAKDCSLR